MNRTNKKMVAGVQKQSVSKGAAGLGKAVDKKLKENSDQIAVALVNGALEGNVNTARFLVSLANTAAGSKKRAKKRIVVSLAKALAGEPEWKGERRDAAQEMAGSQ